MKRLALSCATAFALLLVPAAASARSGTVLRVNRAHHRLEVVDSQHAVRSYTGIAPRTARRLHAGAKVSFQAHGGRISSLRVQGRARKVAFLAKVVSATGGRRLALRLGDGSELRLVKRQLGRHAHRGRAQRSSVQINLEGLDPGQVVLITRRSTLAAT